jgi:hypothetical protein
MANQASTIRRLRQQAVAFGAVLMPTLLAGCAGSEPNVAVSPRSNVTEAQRLLLLSAASGPIPLVIDAVPPVLDGPGQVATLAQEGVADYVRVTLQPQSADEAEPSSVRLLARFRELDTADPGALCRGEPAPRLAPETPPRLQIILCDGQRAVGDAVGIAKTNERADVARLVSRTVGALFPSTHPYGGGYTFPGVSVFGGVGSGGSGVGVGLGF